MAETSPSPTMLAPLGFPTFRAIWVATLASNFGGLIQAVGAAWMMTTLTPSADMVALVQSSTTLPIMIFSLAAGAVADNFPRRGVMLTAQFFMLAVSAALALAAWMDVLGPWALLGFTFLIGCGTALNNPAWQASVGGAFLQGRLRDRLSSETIVRLAFAGFAVCAVGLAVSPSGWTSGLATMVGGACWVLALSLFNVTVQLSTPRWVVGRALALYQTAAFGGMALGSWLWGSVAEVHDSPMALLWAAGAMIAGGGVGLFLPLPGRAELNLDPLNRWQEPKVSIDIRSRSGPIQIEVEFRIAEEDVPTFLALMAERHRIRVRDGARHWALQRDLEDSSLWVETYQTPTWLDYVRHNHRRTHADAGVTDRLRDLNLGGEPPRVHRRIVRQVRFTADSPIEKHDVPHP